MKKQKLNSLNLNKKNISNFALLALKGGGYSAQNSRCMSQCLVCDNVPSKGSICCDI